MGAGKEAERGNGRIDIEPGRKAPSWWELQRTPSRVPEHLALAHIRDIEVAVAKLHDPFPFACQHGPPRMGLGVLLDTKESAPSVGERHRAQVSSPRESDRIPPTAQPNLRWPINQDLAPNRDERGWQRHSLVRSYQRCHPATIAPRRRDVHRSRPFPLGYDPPGSCTCRHSEYPVDNPWTMQKCATRQTFASCPANGTLVSRGGSILVARWHGSFPGGGTAQ